jgi:RNA polymerase sigma factor (sigma-70 family)
VPPPDTTDQTQWFTDEVQPHASQLKAYLRGSFPSVRDVDDVVQESCLRVWKTRSAQPIRSAKSFLFQVARNLAIDILRKDRTTAGESPVDFSTLSVFEDAPDAADALSRQEKIDLLTQALATLPDHTREIVFLRKLQGFPQREVAARLGIAERTVETQLARGMKKCADYLRRRGVCGFAADE